MPGIIGPYLRGYLQAERRELIDGEQAQREIQAMKDDWRSTRG